MLIMEEVLIFDEEIPSAETVAAMQEARARKLPSFCDVTGLLAELNTEVYER